MLQTASVFEKKKEKAENRTNRSGLKKDTTRDFEKKKYGKFRRNLYHWSPEYVVPLHWVNKKKALCLDEKKKTVKKVWSVDHWVLE